MQLNFSKFKGIGNIWCTAVHLCQILQGIQIKLYVMLVDFNVAILFNRLFLDCSLRVHRHLLWYTCIRARSYCPRPPPSPHPGPRPAPCSPPGADQTTMPRSLTRPYIEERLPVRKKKKNRHALW